MIALQLVDMNTVSSLMQKVRTKQNKFWVVSQYKLCNVKQF